LYKCSDRHLLIATGILAVIVLAISSGAHWFPRFPGDLNFILLFQSLHSRILLLVMEGVSYIAEGWRSAIFIIFGSIVIWWRLGKFEAILTIAAGLSSLLNSIFKLAVDRPRPTPDLVHVQIVEHGSGFPSGHSFFAILFFGLMAYFAFNHLRRSSLRRLIVVSLLILIILIGASRIYLGVHWPSDVLGGYLAGTVFLGIFIWLDHAWRRYHSIQIN
jgi:undecaprenyl-diphosphatase